MFNFPPQETKTNIKWHQKSVLGVGVESGWVPDVMLFVRAFVSVGVKMMVSKKFWSFFIGNGQREKFPLP